MPSKYAIWLNYNNDKKKYRLPMNPEELKITVEGKLTTVSIDRLGELVHKHRRNAMHISWSSYFPNLYGSYCACAQNEFKSAAKMHKWIIKLMNAANPVHLVVTGGPFSLNTYAVIKTYKPVENGGDPGTIEYSIELYEYRSVEVTKYTKNTSSKTKKKTTKKTTSKKRVTNTETTKTYTVKDGDCLWNIAKKYYGDGSQYTKIYNANKTILDKTAKKYGYSNCKNGDLIFAGTKITIP